MYGLTMAPRSSPIKAPRSATKLSTKNSYIALSTAIVWAALSASMGVLLTAAFCAHVMAHHYYRLGEDVAVVTTTTSIHHHHDPGGGPVGGLHVVTRPMLQQRSLSVNPFSIQETGLMPQLVWLMSFPNSGTSYTLHLTRETTNMTTATNYALEGDIKDEPSVPVHHSSPQGPFFELIRGRNTTVPPKFILTKTHCGGMCDDCPPQGYIETTRSFEIACRSGKRAFRNEFGRLVTEPATYETPVAKAIHMVRSPLDNVVARFHLARNTMRFRKNAPRNWQERHPNNRTGFQLWCREMDAKSQLTTMRWIDDKLKTLLLKVPCHAEFFRYTQWHNLAFQVTHDKKIPTLVLHYREYEENFDVTVNKLLDFLEANHVGQIEPFQKGKVYYSFYSKEQRRNVKRLLRELSSGDTWEALRGYYF